MSNINKSLELLSCLLCLGNTDACGIVYNPNCIVLSVFVWPTDATAQRRCVCAGALTRCHSRPHDKEHPHCDPLQGGGQQAALLQDGVHHFILQGNQQEDEHSIKHGEPGSWEAERHLRGANKAAD